MKLLRHLGIFVVVALIFAAIGHFLPKALHLKSDALLIYKDAPPPDSTVRILTPREDLQNALPVLKVSKKKRSPVETWIVGKGVSLPVYMLRAQRQILSRSGAVIRMEELNAKQPSARMSWRDSLGDSSTVEIRIGDEFLDGSSRMALAFVINSEPTLAELNALSTLSASYSLLVQPFDTSKTLLFDLDKLPNKEIVAWVGMEPHRYPWISPGPKSILIHHSEKQISDLIDEIRHRLPNASGIATRMGERAVEHKPLMQALLRSLGKNNLWFLDLTQNRFSRASEVCSQLGVACAVAKIKPQETSAEAYLSLSLKSAVKTGNSIAIFPLSEENINAVRAAIPRADSLGTQIVKLSSLMAQIE